MIFKFNLPDKIKNFILNSELEEIGIGCSDSQVIKIKKNDDLFFLKIASKNLLTQEYNALKWLDGKLSVPKIIIYEINNVAEFLITTAINGEMVCSDYYLSHPNEAIKVIAEAFTNIYNIKINDCPFNVALDYKLNLVRNNVKNNLISVDNIKEETLNRFKDLNSIVDYLGKNKFEEELCFSHGDTSLPNIFASNSKFSGFIDVGECGIADKWFDLAICEKSIIRNFGEIYVEKFYNELGIKRDANKIEYYLLMMELYL